LENRALVEAVLEDYRTAPISNQEKALFAFIEKIVQQSNQITQADIDQAKAAGWSDEELYDAITVCALFQFYNTWVDATGVGDLPALAYEMSGKRLANYGYATNQEREQAMEK
jgi:alkylhydroperoxidase family enzyme